MFDFVFAVIAAGINGAGSGGDNSQAVIVAKPAPAAIAAPQTPPAPLATSPTVSMGDGVTLGQNVTIGGAVAGAVTQGGATGSTSLLDGTADQMAPAAQAAAPAPQAAPVVTSGFNMGVVPAGLVADPQEPTGKFTTAAEVKPILNATKGNWVAVREYDGKDLLYVTHLWGWRCGLKAMAISVNGETMQNWPLPPCHMKYATPNAILEDDGLPYLSLKLGAVQSIDIQIVYDDLSMDAASFERGNVLIP